MRILFTMISGNGHFLPLVPVARAAVAAGHAVAFAGFAGMVPMIEAARFTAFPTSGPRAPDAAPRKRRERVPVRPVDPDREQRKMRDGYAGAWARQQAAALLGIAAEWRPDVLVRDEVDFGAAVAAEVLALPLATVIVLSAGSFLRTEVVAGPLNELRAQYGLPPDPELAVLTRGPTLSPCPPSFRDPDFPLPGNAFSYRQAAAVPAGTASRPPTVYVTLGTGWRNADLFSRILAGLKELPVDVVATVGSRIGPAELGPLPDRIRVEKYIPQERLLPGCDLVVSHGGSGSVMGALAHGLPSVLLPMGSDQPDNARRCAKLGTARVLDPVRVTPDEVRAAVSGVLADPEYRRAAERIQDEINALPDVAQTIPLLEALCSAD